jgi:hypothetical protein
MKKAKGERGAEFLAFITATEQQWQELGREREQVEQRRLQLDAEIATMKPYVEAIATLDQGHQYSKNAMEPASEPEAESPATICLRDVCHVALKKFGSMKKTELRGPVEELGWKFTSDNPLAEINIALAGDPSVTIMNAEDDPENHMYRWIGHEPQNKGAL